MYRSIRYKSNVYKHLKYLEKSQWWESEQLRELQNIRLKMIVKHAVENVPYYKQLFKKEKIDVKDISIDNMYLIPPVNKEIIRDNFDEFCAVNCNQYHPVYCTTSGSTGVPFRYCKDGNYAEMRDADSYRGMGFAGYHYGNKLINLGGSSIMSDTTNTFRDRISQFINRIKPLPAIKMDDYKMDEFVKIINSFKPDLIRGYPSALYILSTFIENNVKLRHTPKSVITTAEMLLPHHKVKIEEVFRCSVFNEYGCNDGGLLSYECEKHEGFHYSSERAIVEITKDGNPLHSGVSGDVTLTDLYNLSMPFIRYKNGDIAALTDAKCPCGRNLPLIGAVQGRSGDILKFGTRYISTPALTLIFKDFCFDNYQLVKYTDNLLVIKLIKGKHFQNGEDARLIKILKHHLSDSVEIRINFVDNISTTKAGKYKYFINMAG